MAKKKENIPMNEETPLDDEDSFFEGEVEEDVNLIDLETEKLNENKRKYEVRRKLEDIIEEKRRKRDQDYAFDDDV